MLNTTDDVRIEQLKPLISPALVMEEYPAGEVAKATVLTARAHAENIIKGKDDRLLVVVGPCSIHDPASALDYAQKLQPVMNELAEELVIIMRIYFEKPRTSIGWKGLINDPHLNGSFAINHGLRVARKLLLDLANRQVAAGCEFLDTIIPQYISDLVSWGAIGARTTESQIHRELTSGMSMPIGFKNGTNGNLQIAIDAIKAAKHPHHFLSVTKQGIAAIVATKGNDACHIILRGSTHGTNYDPKSIAHTTELLEKAKLATAIMVDCSHGNSHKDYRRQSLVIDSLYEQISQGNKHICGVMIESHLVAGKQDLVKKENLRYGQSITDACMGWEETKLELAKLAAAVKARRQLKDSS